MRPMEKIRNSSNALEIDIVQIKNLSSTTATFWTMNITAIPASIMPSISLTFIRFTSYPLPLHCTSVFMCFSENPFIAWTTGANIS